MIAENALLAPRLHHQLVPNVLHLEKRYEAGRKPIVGHSKENEEDLKRRGHTVQWDDRMCCVESESQC
jgi:hypothetical protein